MSLQVFEKLYRWQYPIFMLLTFGIAYLKQTSNSSIMPLYLVFWLVYGAMAFSRSNKSQFKTVYTILLAYIVFSVVEYGFNGLPFKYYYSDVRGLVVPMLSVYIGMINNDERLYKWFVLSTVFCILVGLFLYFVQPSWYLSFKVASLENSLKYEGVSELNVMSLSTSGRFSSFFPTTYPVAYFTTFSLCITLNDLYKENENRLFKSNGILLLIIGVLIIGIVLSLTRVAIAYLILLLGYYFAFGYIKKNKNRHLVRAIIIAIVAVVVVAFIQISSSEYGALIIERMEGRLTLDAVDQLTSEGSRIEQTEVAFSAWKNKVFGDGMGSRGGAARADLRPGITDDDWIRVLVEFGVVGMILILTVFSMSIRKAFQRRRYFLAELSIILYGVISMLVADTLYKGPLVLIFWFALGRIWNQQLYLNRVKENNCI